MRQFLLMREYVRAYTDPRYVLPKIAGTEWDENWRSWPHCNGQAGCWMHYPAPTSWCGCACRWCRVARRLRPGLDRWPLRAKRRRP